MRTSINLICAILFYGVATLASAGDFDTVVQVLSVTPRIEQVNRPVRECRTEYVSERSSQRYTGATIGGAAGGIIGNQIGSGNGRVVATAAGAIVGAIVGNRLENNGETTIERPVRNCRTVDNWQSRTSGYAVTYEYQGRANTAVLPYDPGQQMRIRVSTGPRF